LTLEKKYSAGQKAAEKVHRTQSDVKYVKLYSCRTRERERERENVFYEKEL